MREKIYAEGSDLRAFLYDLHKNVHGKYSSLVKRLSFGHCYKQLFVRYQQMQKLKSRDYVYRYGKIRSTKRTFEKKGDIYIYIYNSRDYVYRYGKILSKKRTFEKKGDIYIYIYIYDSSSLYQTYRPTVIFNHKTPYGRYVIHQCNKYFIENPFLLLKHSCRIALVCPCTVISQGGMDKGRNSILFIYCISELSFS